MTVVFDNVCNVCDAFVRFLASRDRRGRLTFVAATSVEGRRLLTGAGLSEDRPSTLLVLDGERQQTRSSAVLTAVASLGGGWRYVRVFSIVPPRLRDILYDGFARRRYRWFGSVAACETCGVTARIDQP